MNCPDCNHRQHKPGQCKHCNCGEAEISHPENETRPEEMDHVGGNKVHRLHDRGHRVKKRRTDGS